MKKTVIVVRGIPASGKSTWVKERMAEFSDGAAIRLNNDDMSEMLFASTDIHSKERGALLRDARLALLRTYLRREGSPSVIFIDNTNLIKSTVKGIEDIALQEGAEFHVVDDFLSADVEECVRRDTSRARVVGEKVIRKMSTLTSKCNPWVDKGYPVVEPYNNDSTLPWVVLMDIDGTVAIKHPDRGIYDGSLAHLDTPNIPIVTTLRALRQLNHVEVIAMSGRGDNDRKVTEDWIKEHVGEGITLHMRKDKDLRPDWVVKYEMFQEHIAGKFHVLAAFEDRDQMVHLYRRRLYLPTVQVADGNF